MNSAVGFRVPSSPETFSLRLVYPRDVEETGTVSLIAVHDLASARAIESNAPNSGDGMLEVTIEGVIDQPERAASIIAGAKRGATPYALNARYPSAIHQRLDERCNE